MALRFAVGCACLLLVANVPAFASGAKASSMMEAEASELAPGDYRWEPPPAPDGPISMVVNLGSQLAYVYDDGKLIGVSTISSGKPGHETPTGNFTVLEKLRFHRSNKYDNAPMPFMQRLSWSGLALHGGHPHGYPASHGCIRMPMGFAAALFKEKTGGMQVVITGHAPARGDIAIASREKARSNSQALPVSAGDDDAVDLNPDAGQSDQPDSSQDRDDTGRSEDAPPQDIPPRS